MLWFSSVAGRGFARGLICSILVAGLVTFILPPSILDARASDDSDFSVRSVAPGTAGQPEVHLHRAGLSGFSVVLRNGERVCTEAAHEDSLRLQRRAAALPMRQIAVRSRAEAQTAPFSGMKITLRGTPQLDTYPEAKAAFLRAAAQWESLIESPISIVIDVDFGENNFGEPFGEDVIGSTATQLVGSDTIYGPLRSRLINTAQAPARRALLSLLPTSGGATGGLPTDLGRTSAIVGPATIFRALGFLDPVADPAVDEDDIGPPPAIGFNAEIPFDFDPRNGITPGQFDFEATAIHEIGHALGFISNVGQGELTPEFDNEPAPLDFFRFRPEVNFDAFATANRIQTPGGEHVFFASGTPIRLSTARPDGEGGDGQQASHWKDDGQTGVYLGIMDPTARSGRREMISANDLLAFASIGYRVRTPDRAPTEELAADDGEISGGVSGVANLILVNRLTPSGYPARLDAVRIYIAQFTNAPNPTGVPIRLVAFVGAGAPGANPTLLVDQVVAVPQIVSSGDFIEIPLTNGPVIDSGDFFVGFQRLSGTAQNSFSGVLFPIDDGAPAAMRTFASTDGGATFGGPLTVTRSGSSTPSPANLLVRARVSIARGARIGSITALANTEISATIEFLAKGDEAQVRFSLTFDPRLLDFVSIAPGDDGVPAPQTQLDLVNGRIGVTVVNNQGRLFAEGRRRLARAVFRIKVDAAPGSTMIEFGDQPTARGVFNLTANDILSETSFTNGLVTIAGAATVASAASFATTEMAPESIAAVFGSNLAIGVSNPSSTPLPAGLLGTTVEVRDSTGRQALSALFFVSSAQINFQIPPGLATGPATVTVRSGDERVSIALIEIVDFAPGLFAANADGKGVAAANIVRVRGALQLFEEVSRFDPAQNRFLPLPIDLGPEAELVFLVLYGSGLRYRPEGATVTVTVGGISVPVAFLGPSGSFIGLDQVNLGPLPRSLAGRGTIDIQLTIDGKNTNVVQAAIR